MTQIIELLDSLPGTGKTHAITRYMADNRGNPWLYLSPLASEVYGIDDNDQGAVVAKAAENNLLMYTPGEDSDLSKTEQVLKYLQDGLDVACTHNLMLRFTKEHIKAIKKHNYNVVCDETLDLLSAYNLEKDDYDFLKLHDLITICPENGRVSFKDVEMGNKARYADVKTLCDLGCLFAAPRSDRMLVTQLSTDLLKECNRFILITYNYKGSLMDNFLSLHGFSNKRLEGIKTRFDNNEAKKKIENLLTILESRSVLKVQQGSANKLSKSWWNNSNSETKDEIFKVINSCIKTSKVCGKEEYIFTCPKDVITPKTTRGYKPKSTHASKDSWIACNCRATNEYSKAKLAIQAYNLFPNVSVVAYLQDMDCKVDSENYALNMLIQWVWRGCIRNAEPMTVAFLSKRMSTIFKEWLTRVDLPT